MTSALERATAGHRRHGRSGLRVLTPGGPQDAESPLIERAVELDAVAGAVSRLAEGQSGVVLVEAAAGQGKTALIDHAVRLATDAGCLVRGASPGPLERHFAFGVIRSLLEAPLREAPADERACLLDGVAVTAGELLLAGTVPSGDPTMTIAHSVLWLCSALAERRPLALVLDDAQWADRPSLEVLLYLARRIADVPLLIVVGARPDDPDGASDLLSMLGGVRAATVVQPRCLTVSGAARLIRRLAPDTPLDVCRDCHRAAHGNPWLLGELARQIAVHGTAAVDDVGTDGSPVSTVARGVVRRRLATLTSRDRSVVAALAVIGDGAAPQVLAAVAEVAIGELGATRDALVAAGLVLPGGDRLAHGLIASAIIQDLPGSERERLHREAARALTARGVDADAIAGHLLRCAPQADAEVTALLWRAAGAASLRGAPHTAVAYLERALQERAAGDDCGRMLAQLAAVAFDAGLPGSRLRLREALGQVTDRESRVDVLTRLATLNVIDVGDTGMSELLERELEAASDPDTRLALEAAALDTLMMLPGRHAERAQRAATAALTATTDPLLERVVTAHRAWLAAEQGAPDANRCAALALEALEGDVLLGQARQRPAFHLCTHVLIVTDHVADAGRTIEAMRADAKARGSLRLRAGASWYAAELALRTGRVADAENDARLVLDLIGEDVNVFTGGAVAVLVCALAERGAFAEADELLRERSLDGPIGSVFWEIGVLHARSRLRLAQGDFARAHDDACRAGALREQQGRTNPTFTAWRSTAALALAHVGRRDEAAGLADAELALAEAFGAPAPIVAALHARIVAEPDPAVRLRLCERALAVAAGKAPGLAAARVRLELGSTLARLGRRTEGRGALRQALADADAVGAVLVAQRARRELVATGLRPRRAQVEGIAALTPRQRQVCELAARGIANRAIAQQLFLSVKTVETHLAASYRKLGVDTRAGLAEELAGAAGPAGDSAAA